MKQQFNRIVFFIAIVLIGCARTVTDKSIDTLIKIEMEFESMVSLKSNIQYAIVFSDQPNILPIDNLSYQKLYLPLPGRLYSNASINENFVTQYRTISAMKRDFYSGWTHYMLISRDNANGENVVFYKANLHNESQSRYFTEDHNQYLPEKGFVYQNGYQLQIRNQHLILSFDLNRLTSPLDVDALKGETRYMQLFSLSISDSTPSGVLIDALIEPVPIAIKANYRVELNDNIDTFNDSNSGELNIKKCTISIY
jgi:hypothetical protein